MTATKRRADLGVILVAEAMAQGVSVYALAKRAELPVSVVQSTLGDGSRPRVDTLAAILRALGKSWAWLDEQGFEP
jgi:DNA-binding phage protein